VATFEVTEKKVRVESGLTLELDLDEAAWLLDAATVRNISVPSDMLVKQLWNATKQMQEMERG
jgi:hypothetical protein